MTSSNEERPDLPEQIPGGGARMQSVERSARSIEAAAIAGIVYAILGIAALILLSRFPNLDQTDTQLMEWFADGTNQVTLILGLNLAAFSSIAFLWFIAVIRRRLGRLEDEFLSTVFLGSGLTFVGLWLAYAASVAMPALSMSHFEGASVSRDSISNAAGLSSAFLFVIAPRIQAVFMLVTSVLILRSRGLPKWLAVVGFVMAAVMVAFLLVVEPLEIAFPAWVFLVSVVILVVRPDVSDDQVVSGT